MALTYTPCFLLSWGYPAHGCDTMASARHVRLPDLKKDALVGNLSHSSNTEVRDSLLACSCGVLSTQVLHVWLLSEHGY